MENWYRINTTDSLFTLKCPTPHSNLELLAEFFGLQVEYPFNRYNAYIKSPFNKELEEAMDRLQLSWVTVTSKGKALNRSWGLEMRCARKACNSVNSRIKRLPKWRQL